MGEWINCFTDISTQEGCKVIQKLDLDQMSERSIRCILKDTYEPVTKGPDLKWDTLPQNRRGSKLFSVLPLESGMFQVTISIIKKWF